MLFFYFIDKSLLARSHCSCCNLVFLNKMHWGGKNCLREPCLSQKKDFIDSACVYLYIWVLGIFELQLDVKPMDKLLIYVVIQGCYHSKGKKIKNLCSFKWISYLFYFALCSNEYSHKENFSWRLWYLVDIHFWKTLYWLQLQLMKHPSLRQVDTSSLHVMSMVSEVRGQLWYPILIPVSLYILMPGDIHWLLQK